MQGFSASGVGSCVAACVLDCSPRRWRQMGSVSRFDKQSLWRQRLFKTTRSVGSGGSKGGDPMVRAAWSFGGGVKGSGGASSERSESANEDILLFFFQLDLRTRIQYALNMEQYDVAQQLRNKLAEVEAESVKQQEAKGVSSLKSNAQDKALNLLRLRADLQKAIDSEDYVTAADLRDEISVLEVESLAISAKALAYEKTQYSFRLGQKVKHKLFGYQGVVCGMDPVCCESKSWMEMAHVHKLSKGAYQPFYQVLVDVHADPDILVAYVPEENLLEFSSQTDTDMLDHPYVSFLFYGMDSAGNFIPIRQLREKNNRPRYEVPLQNESDD